MDVCLPADFQIFDDAAAADYREPLRYVDEGPASYEDGYWLGAEALVTPLPLNDPARPGPRRKRGTVADDPSWCVV
jgi:hypothetical protein